MIVRRSAAAQDDFDDIWLYVAQDSPSAADVLLLRLEEATANLGAFPDMGVLRDDLAKGLRALRVDNFVVYYRKHHDHVMLARVLHARLDTKRISF
ncbi:MAG: hypothetical protein DI570_19165 [Phenylobacterium zucineum]|nr:MAG: hypothetical protein DI570_19165 [Phenylobacterium zucineum]